MDILTSKADGILTIEFNRPERKNAITAVMYQAMADAINEAETDSAVRAILLVGKPEIFTAGNDLPDFLQNSKACQPKPVRCSSSCARCPAARNQWSRRYPAPQSASAPRC